MPLFQDGPFNWDTTTQGYILGSFFYGYVVTQIPGGRMAEVFGGKWIFGIGILITSVFTLLTPLAANYSFIALIVVRVIEGRENRSMAKNLIFHFFLAHSGYPNSEHLQYSHRLKVSDSYMICYSKSNLITSLN